MESKSLFGLFLRTTPKWAWMFIVVTCIAGILSLVITLLLLWYDQIEDPYGFQHILFNTWTINLLVYLFGMFLVVLPWIRAYATMKALRDLG